MNLSCDNSIITTFHCQIFVKQKGTEIRISEMFGIDNIIMHKIHNFLLTQEQKSYG